MALAELLKNRTKALNAAEAIVAVGEKENRPLTELENNQLEGHLAEVGRLNARIEPIRENNTLAALVGKHGPTILFGDQPTLENGGIMRAPGNFNKPMSREMQTIADYMTGRVSASDTPLQMGGSNLGAIIVQEVLDRETTYLALDSFRFAGATIYNTDSTVPLVKPIISAGPDADTFGELQSSSESKPFAVDSFTFGGQKYSSLVKVSEEALMNSALNLQAEIIAELTVRMVNTMTKASTAALMMALDANSSCYVAQGSDAYASLQSLIHAVPIRYDDPTNAFMMSRHDLNIVKNSRTSFGQPLFDPTSGTIFNRPVVLNDSLTRVVYGNWRAGAYLRRTPYFLLPLRELYSASGEWGFRSTQWQDQKFTAAVPSVTVQPLYFTNLEGAGS
jgi:HK97 family phage major capsid protein